ncbi:MAG TPA: CehA/McbA family metallohydrolase [candidate division Zixibacteria bacterium]|nr:CehA/McbA family metallohydrolase [candidate division Zixibacteria bacterium]
MNTKDGPSSEVFSALTFQGNFALEDLGTLTLTNEMADALDRAPRGETVSWGIPLHIDNVIAISDEPVTVHFVPTLAKWFVFAHTSDLRPPVSDSNGFISPMRGQGQLGEHAADYVLLYHDGEEERVKIRRRYQIGAFRRIWGENCFEAVGHRKPFPVPPLATPGWPSQAAGWGSQMRVRQLDGGEGNPPWINWLWAWENPHPGKVISGVRLEPASGLVIVSAISAGNSASNPLRWERRKKACLCLPKGEPFLSEMDEGGLLGQIQLDMGQVISAVLRPIYPDDHWADSYNNQIPERSETEIIVEYTAHTDACFHFASGKVVPIQQVVGDQVSDVEDTATLRPVAAAKRKFTLRAVDTVSGKPVPVKIHVHGEWGEYLAPVDRPRIPNPAWFEDNGFDFVHGGTWNGSTDNAHFCSYISGETTLNLPLGKVYIEVSKGFEIRPWRMVFDVTSDTEEITIEIKKVLPWREKGWVSADTHVHFLSPISALLEGSAEGVNVINLLASQWGELMTDVGDFDGKTTWGSLEAGGDGEYLVRVGTENRQHVMGHISLLGYQGQIIAPMTTGGPDESALGDPIEILLTEWARQCKKQGGLVVVPHFPNPRAEHAASIVSDDVDAIEMTSWGNLYAGIDPYSLSDWYRYLNCGYAVPVVGGTDKMSANTAVGTVRTYARINPNERFNYETWMAAVRQAETFVTYGPLLEFSVDGQPMGSQIQMSSTGGNLEVHWQVASATIPMTRVELVINGEIRESAPVSSEIGSGHWSVKIDKSAWLALLVRGHYPDKPEIIAAHSSAVMIHVQGSPMFAAADALTILEQIEGAQAYLDSVGTRAEDIAYKRMRLVLQASHRSLHNRMHQLGYYHGHSVVMDHPEHH